jgi:hypothetical protein
MYAKNSNMSQVSAVKTQVEAYLRNKANPNFKRTTDRPRGSRSAHHNNTNTVVQSQVCAYCKQQGHRIGDAQRNITCPVLIAKKQRGENVECRYCHEKGHHIKDRDGNIVCPTILEKNTQHNQHISNQTSIQCDKCAVAGKKTSFMVDVDQETGRPDKYYLHQHMTLEHHWCPVNKCKNRNKHESAEELRDHLVHVHHSSHERATTTAFGRHQTQKPKKTHTAAAVAAAAIGSSFSADKVEWAPLSRKSEVATVEDHLKDAAVTEYRK